MSRVLAVDVKIYITPFGADVLSAAGHTLVTAGDHTQTLTESTGRAIQAGP